MTATDPDTAVRRRRRWPWVLVTLVVLGLAAGAWIGLRAVQAKSQLDDARAQLEAARSALLDREIGAARAAISSASESTGKARDLTGDPVWRAVAAIPVLGNNLQVARGLAVAADDIAADVLPAALAGAEGLDPGKARRADGSIDIALLESVTPGVRASATEAAKVDDRVRDLDTSALLAQVADARTEFAEASAELRSSLEGASAALEISPALLGKDKPRRYLMLVQQTSESRGTGGLPGGYAEVVARGGKLDVVSQGSNAGLKSGAIPAPAGVPKDWVDRYEAQASLAIWQNVNVSPDLPVVAKVVEARWKAQGGAALDGVVMIDAKALQAILAGSGPVDLGGGRQIPAEQLEDYLAIGQYAGLTSPSTPQDARKEQLDLVAAAAVRKLTAGGGDSTALLRGLSTAVRSGHLRMASQDAALAGVLARTGTDGSLPRGEAPVAYPVVFNATGGKLDYFLDRDVTYAAGSCSKDRRRAVITTTLTSQVPATPLPPYLTIRIEDQTVTQSPVNRLGVMVYATRGAKLIAATVDGKPVSAQFGKTEVLLEPGSEAGLPVWQVYLDLEPGKARTFAVEVDEPVTAGEVRIPEQPLARALTRTTIAPVCR